MKHQTQILEDKIICSCLGEMEHDEFLIFKKTLLSTLNSAPLLKDLHIILDSSPLHLSILGFFLKLCNTDLYRITLKTGNYSIFKTLENLYLLEKLNVKYLKEEQ